MTKKTTTCAYCLGKGISAKLLKYGWRIACGEGLAKNEIDAVPCGYCHKPKVR